MKEINNYKKCVLTTEFLCDYILGNMKKIGSNARLIGTVTITTKKNIFESIKIFIKTRDWVMRLGGKDNKLLTINNVSLFPISFLENDFLLRFPMISCLLIETRNVKR